MVDAAKEVGEELEALLPDLEDGPQIIVTRAVQDYPAIRSAYYGRVYEAVGEYMSTALPITRYRNAVGKAIAESFPPAFYAGYGEASGSDEVLAEDDQWLTDQMNAAIGYVDGLFDHLRDLRKAGNFEADAIATKHAESYAVTLDSIFGQGRLRGNLNVMLTFARDPDFPPSADPCIQCSRWEGRRHRARTWLKKDLVRRNGNENFDCGRWEPCHHYLYKDDGTLWSI